MQKDAIIYNDIISLLEKGIISKNGNPIGYDFTSANRRHLILRMKQLKWEK